MELAVVTELTEEGKKIPAPTAETPAYYLAQSSGFHAEGHGYQSPPPIQITALEGQLNQSLSENHYLPAAQGHPPTLVLFYVWGVHNRLDPEVDDVGNRNLLSRAQLVGGVKFANELGKALAEWDTSGAFQGDLADPVHRFIERDDLTRQLMEQIFNDCYYVVVSAYEGAAIAKGQKKLLWRTKMTTSSQGLGLKETLPVLIAGGGQFFGREMTGASVVDKQLHRGGRVDIGEAQVKEYLEPDVDKKPADRPKE